MASQFYILCKLFGVSIEGMFAARGGCENPGGAAILHTWSQNLLFHPHIHCVVPSGGLAPGRTRWIRGSATFFLPLEVLQQVFRGKFVDGLQQAFNEKRLNFSGLIQHLAKAKNFAEFLRKLHRHKWVVYAKPSFGGPEQVLRYLGRYTHRVAISNHRLISFDGDHVRFRWRDYAHGNKKRKMTLSAEEFIRRFLLHVLPKGFVRIRHCGFMANYQRSASLNICRQLLDMAHRSFYGNNFHQFRSLVSDLSWANHCR